jgi:hypothetical protein
MTGFPPPELIALFLCKVLTAILHEFVMGNSLDSCLFNAEIGVVIAAKDVRSEKGYSFCRRYRTSKMCLGRQIRLSEDRYRSASRVATPEIGTPSSSLTKAVVWTSASGCRSAQMRRPEPPKGLDRYQTITRTISNEFGSTMTIRRSA